MIESTGRGDAGAVNARTASRLPNRAAVERVCMGLLVGLAVACVHIAGASASTFTVDSAADAGDSNTGDGLCDDGTGHCTLRAAIQQADASGGANTINVPAGSYLLSAGNLIVTNPTNNLAIVGTGAAGTVIIDGQSTLQIFNLQGGTITLSNLVIQNGKSQSPIRALSATASAEESLPGGRRRSTSIPASSRTMRPSTARGAASVSCKARSIWTGARCATTAAPTGVRACGSRPRAS
jgi:CSLREA domain-containing protein